MAKTYNKELINLVKLYINEFKYNSENDNFNFKLTIFINFYYKTDILKQEFSQAYSIILRGLTFDYYYINFKSKLYSIPFNKLYKAIYNYFKRLEYKRDIFI